MKNMFKIAALSLAVLMLAFAFAGCGKKDDGKVYKIVSDNAFKPFEYLDAATNTYVGFDMDLLAAIAADQGFKYTVENVGFDAALGQVQAGQADAVIAGMTIKPDRAEIFRGGIQAVPKGQTEAARSLGLSSAKTMLRVVLPQAFKIAIPSLVNQFIITVKDTSILSVIGLAEVVNRAKQYVGSTFSFFATYVYVGALYLVVISLLMVLSRRIEKRMSYDRKG